MDVEFLAVIRVSIVGRENVVDREALHRTDLAAGQKVQVIKTRARGTQPYSSSP